MQMGFEEMPTNQSPAAMNRPGGFLDGGNAWSVWRHTRYPLLRGHFRKGMIIYSFFSGVQKNWMIFGVWRHFLFEG